MNAIILAAGLGSRLSPLTSECPKPLITIDGISIIERQIDFIRSIGIDEIYIVTGYLSEKFEYLKKKYKVVLIYNKEYNRYNNIYSFYLCRAYFGHTWVFDGDVFLNRNFLSREISTSTYFSGRKQVLHTEWELKFSNLAKLENIIIHDALTSPDSIGQDIYVISGVSYWTEESAQIILKELENKMNVLARDDNSSIGNEFWDQLVLDNLDKLNIKVETINCNDWIEIDSVEDILTFKTKSL